MKKSIVIKTYENEELLIIENLTGILKNSYLQFSNDNNTFKIDLKDEMFLKENTDSILKINKERCELTLKELNSSVEIPLILYSFQKNNNLITITYRLESQEKNLKIEISLGDELNV